MSDLVIATWLECFPEKLSLCRNEQVCQGGQNMSNALSGPTDWIFRYVKTVHFTLELLIYHRRSCQRFQVLFAHKRVRGYCNITNWCKAHHKTTAMFLSNHTVSVSRKSRKKEGPSPSENWPKQSLFFCPRAMGIVPPLKCPYVVML